MGDPLTLLHQRQQETWLQAPGGDRLIEWVACYREAIHHSLERGHSPRILLVESDPVLYLAGFLAASGDGCPVFLGNPTWGVTEYQQAIQQIQPDDIWGNPPSAVLESAIAPVSNSSEIHDYGGCIFIPTGGSSGTLRFALHTWSTLIASVQGFQQYFQVERVHSCCVLPIYHVSGLMQFLRSFTSGGQLHILPFKALTAQTLPTLDPTSAFLSLVPTQLQRLLDHPVLLEWLARFQTVLLGGAPAWSDLLEQARHHRIRLAPTYGMTETASQVATLKPDAFLGGHHSCGSVLPHARIAIWDDAGQPLPSPQVGRIVIEAASLAWGYYPDPIRPISTGSRPPFTTDDQGFFDQRGELVVVGRNSTKIITGGEKVFPEEVEAQIQATGLVRDVCVVGVGDRQWGEVVTAIYVPRTATIRENQLHEALQGKLSAYKRPKQWIAVEVIPRNGQGKVNREWLKTAVIASAIEDR